VWRCWRSPEATIPIGPTTLLARTDIIRGSGGYAALPQGEDYAYLVGVTGAAYGALMPTVVYHYRKHPDQMTAQLSYQLLESRARQFAYSHGEQLAALYEEARQRVGAWPRDGHEEIPLKAADRATHSTATFSGRKSLVKP
jgi:hypothetical protein